MNLDGKSPIRSESWRLDRVRTAGTGLRNNEQAIDRMIKAILGNATDRNGRQARKEIRLLAAYEAEPLLAGSMAGERCRAILQKRINPSWR